MAHTFPLQSAGPLVLWHASPADIERPTVAGRTPNPDHHDNSGLGLFCATGPHDYLEGFGTWIHALTLKDKPRTFILSIRDLSQMGGWKGDNFRDRDWFETEGRRLAQEHDVIALMESNGRCDQAIILRDDVIVASRRFSLEAFFALGSTSPTNIAAVSGVRSPRRSL